METPTLETTRLILRPLTLGDAPTIQRLLPHWNMVQYLATVPWPYPDDGAVDYLSNTLLPAMQRGDALAWAVTVKEEGLELRGQLGYQVERGESVIGNRGFWLGERHWGNGYMSEAVTASVDYVFSKAGFDTIHAENAVANTASSRIKHNTIGRLVEIRDGDFVCGRGPCECWEITKAEWLAAQE